MAGNRKAKLLAFAITIFTLILLYNSIEMTSEFDLKPQPALRQDQAEFDEFSFEEFGTKNGGRKSSMFFDKEPENEIKSDATEDNEAETEENKFDEEEGDYDDEAEEENDEEEAEDYVDDEDDDEMTDIPDGKIDEPETPVKTQKNKLEKKKPAKDLEIELPNPYLPVDLPPPTNENPFKKVDPRFRKKLDQLCKETMWQTLKTCVRPDPPGFVITGDIADMWIRDSAAQVNNYIGLMKTRPDLKDLMVKVVERQSFFIKFDPYANAYRGTYNKKPTPWEQSLNRYGYVATGNYELDSGAYFFKLAYKVWKVGGVLVDVREGVKAMIDTWIIEQNHEEKSKYRYSELSRNGKGGVTGYTGMTWTGYRPSDDPCIYHYLIPANIFAAVGLGYAKEMLLEWGESEYYKKASKLKTEIEKGVAKHGLAEFNGKTIYCYEVDGLGGCNKMDDANIPSLLSLPYIDPGASVYDEQIYENTKAFILSKENKYYFSGKYSVGIGSPHTRHGNIWHMALIMEALLSNDDSKRQVKLIEEIVETTEKTVRKKVGGRWDYVDGTMHESFDPNDPTQFSRSWFAWADTLFAEGRWCDGARGD
jgi:meiotically up-regulated gene 157 (Mug157) protein